ncbi:MAG TPA: hypothetical protein VFR17_10135 [Mycobacterium sp.]|nr:hypothetical protein [Mycobacterium sp.]
MTPDPGSDSDERPAGVRFYRQRPGLVWVIGLVIIPLFLGVIGYSMYDRTRPHAGDQLEFDGAAPTLVEPGSAAPEPPPGLALAPLSVVRNGDQITMEGNLSDPADQQALLDIVIASAGEQVDVVDRIGIVPDLKVLNVAAAGPVFEAAADIHDFRLTVRGDTVTLAGTAANVVELDAVADAAEDAWPDLNIVNELQVNGPLTPTATPGSGSGRSSGGR